MNLDVLQLLIYGGPSAVLLGVLLVWYLPFMLRKHAETLQLKDARHAETIQRIHSEDHQEQSTQIQENTRCTRQLARAVLVASLTSQGKTVAEAEQEARRIISNGGP